MLVTGGTSSQEFTLSQSFWTLPTIFPRAYAELTTVGKWVPHLGQNLFPFSASVLQLGQNRGNCERDGFFLFVRTRARLRKDSIHSIAPPGSRYWFAIMMSKSEGSCVVKLGVFPVFGPWD